VLTLTAAVIRLIRSLGHGTSSHRFSKPHASTTIRWSRNSVGPSWCRRSINATRLSTSRAPSATDFPLSTELLDDHKARVVMVSGVDRSRGFWRQRTAALPPGKTGCRRNVFNTCGNSCGDEVLAGQAPFLSPAPALVTTASPGKTGTLSELGGCG